MIRTPGGSFSVDPLRKHAYASGVAIRFTPPYRVGMDPLSHLRKIPLFRDLPADQIDAIFRAVRERTLPPGTNVMEIGDAGHALFIILEGEVLVLSTARSAEFELARLGPGDFFGEMALLNDRPRSATVRTASETRLLVLDQKDFREILLASPVSAVKLLETLSLRIRNADEQISILSDKARRDTLTGLLNRPAFHERLNQEVDRNRRYGDEFALVLLDIDHFRSVNGKLGREVGDRVLSWMGRLLTEHTRAADVPFRVGGEEFAILAPATSGEIAGIAAERLVRMVEEAQPPGNFDLPLTISAGFASCPQDTTDPQELYDLADRALLEAKGDGRNRVASPPARA